MTSAEQAIRDARNARVRASLGLANIPPSSWTYEQRVAYNKALASAILSDSAPATAQDLATAQAIAAKEYSPLETYTLGDAASDFTAELVNQAQGVNPFSEQNRGKTRNVLIALVLLAGTVFFGVLAWRTAPQNPNPRPPGGDDLFAARVPAAPKRRRKK
jgi:hypothetical protein